MTTMLVRNKSVTRTVIIRLFVGISAQWYAVFSIQIRVNCSVKIKKGKTLFVADVCTKIARYLMAPTAHFHWQKSAEHFAWKRLKS